MKKTYLKIWSLAMGIVLFSLFSSNAYSASAGCVAEKAEFKKLYLELQAKFLNYEGKDTVVDSKGNMTLVAHDPSKPYDGKLFETAIFHEYQNSLKKVAKLYQTAKFSSAADDIKKSTPGLVDFLKAIDDNQNSDYIQKNKIGDVIDELAKVSNAKFGNTSDKKFALTENDKYLLKKLLTHAQDRVCSVETFEKTGKRTKLFDADYLGQVRNAPLNRLIGAIKNAKIGAESELLVDENAAISSAMSEHLNQLAAWMKRNEVCRKAITNPAFIQANIQSCNYLKFLDVLNQPNLDEIQAVLHFINSNEKLLNRTQAKAETALDELKLESYIDSTFSNLSNKVGCSKVEGKNGKRIFVRNLPYKDNKFDTSKILCKVKEKDLKPADCAQKIELISDELGRGLELKQKAKTGAAVTFSIADNADCSNLATAPLALVGSVVKPTNDTPVVDPKKDDNTKICDEKKCGQQVLTTAKYFWKADLKACYYTLGDDKKEFWQCSLDGKEPAAPAVDDHKCTNDKSCREKNKDAVWDATLSGCYTQPKEGDKVFVCNADGAEKKPEVKPDNKCTDKQKLVDGKCQETADSCKAKAKKDEYLKPSEDGLSCVAVSGSELCDLKNKDWAANKKKDAEDDGASWSTRYKWNSETKKCDDKEKKKESKEDDSPSDDTQTPQYAPKQAPGRFQPINIPTRQMYILPGMP